MDDTFTRYYRTPDISPGYFAGEHIISIAAGRERIAIHPEDIDAVIDALEDAADWIANREDRNA